MTDKERRITVDLPFNIDLPPFGHSFTAGVSSSRDLLRWLCDNCVIVTRKEWERLSAGSEPVGVNNFATTDVELPEGLSLTDGATLRQVSGPRCRHGTPTDESCISCIGEELALRAVAMPPRQMALACVHGIDPESCAVCADLEDRHDEEHDPC